MFIFISLIDLLISRMTIIHCTLLNLSLASPTDFSRINEPLTHFFYLFFQVGHIFLMNIPGSLSSLSIFGLLNFSFILSWQFRGINTSEISKCQVVCLLFFFPYFSFLFNLLFMIVLSLLKDSNGLAWYLFFHLL